MWKLELVGERNYTEKFHVQDWFFVLSLNFGLSSEFLLL